MPTRMTRSLTRACAQFGEFLSASLSSPFLYLCVPAHVRHSSIESR